MDKVICTFVLPNHTSVFSAEIIAIYETIKNCNASRECAIFTDSLSALQAISDLHYNNYYASSIINSLIKYFPKYIIIWIPGHVSMKGNEFAYIVKIPQFYENPTKILMVLENTLKGK